MARINNLTNFLTDVATAIKNKKGSETPIPAANFDTEITNLPSQGVYQTKTTTITQNGTTTVTPDTGYDAIEQLDITVNVPLQSKTYTFTQNATTTIVPDQGYAGFSQVGLEINVPGTDTSDADAIASNIEENKTAYVNGQKITGTIHIPNQFGISKFNDNPRTVRREHSLTDNTWWVDIECKYNVTTSNGKYIITDGMDSFTYIKPEDLYPSLYITADKILAGQSIFQLDGTATSDATATASDIMKDKTAYVNGQKITGTNEGGVTPTGTKSITENGVYDIRTFADVDVNVPTTGVMTQEEYDEAVATLDDLLTGEYKDVYNVMNEVTDTPEDDYNGVGGTPTQIENKIDALLGVNN